MEGLSAGLIREVIISDGGSQDRTCDIAEEAGCEIVQGPASRGGQLARGAGMARGEWFLFLHADTMLEPGWSTDVVAQMKTGASGYFKLRFDDPSFGAGWVAGWANLRARVFRLPYGDQGLLVSREIYEASGGYPDIPLMEDVALVRRLSGRLTPLAATATTSWARYERAGWLRRGAKNITILLRYLLGASPERLAASYRK